MRSGGPPAGSLANARGWATSRPAAATSSRNGLDVGMEPTTANDIEERPGSFNQAGAARKAWAVPRAMLRPAYRKGATDNDVTRREIRPPHPRRYGPRVLDARQAGTAAQRLLRAWERLIIGAAWLSVTPTRPNRNRNVNYRTTPAGKPFDRRIPRNPSRQRPGMRRKNGRPPDSHTPSRLGDGFRGASRRSIQFEHRTAWRRSAGGAAHHSLAFPGKDDSRRKRGMGRRPYHDATRPGERHPTRNRHGKTPYQDVIPANPAKQRNTAIRTPIRLPVAARTRKT